MFTARRPELLTVEEKEKKKKEEKEEEKTNTLFTEGEKTEVFVVRLEHQWMLWDHLTTVGASVDAVGPSDYGWSISGCSGTI